MRARSIFTQLDVGSVLELGCGPGRDTRYLLDGGFRVTALDYAPTALASLAGQTAAPHLLTTVVHDVRSPLPFADGTFDACYSHMFLCMDFSAAQIARILAEVHRVLRPDSPCIYTARNDRDPDFGSGDHIDEALYDVDGYRLHFFSRAMIGRTASDFTISTIEEFEEGDLPKRLSFVVLRKRCSQIDDRR